MKNSVFLLTELIKRDFLKRYKRTALGLLWSVLSPLLLLLVMNYVFSFFFSKDIEHYPIYLFSGFVQYQFFQSTTIGAIPVLYNSSVIYTKINVNKLLFIASNNVAYLISYIVTLTIYFVFVAMDGIAITISFLSLLWPVAFLVIITFSVSVILSTLNVFISDIKYVYTVAARILLYASGVFYDVTQLPIHIQKIMSFNPLYLSIEYFRQVVIYGHVPDVEYHFYMILYCMGILAFSLIIFGVMEKKFYKYV